MSEALRQLAAAWMADDPDPVTHAATAVMLATDDLAGLEACFGGRLSFGTAGLRGALGPGPNRMNRALVRRVAAGLGHYLLGNAPIEAGTTKASAPEGEASAREGEASAPEGVGLSVAIGFDGRHGSAAFAEDTARVLAGLGITCHLFDGVCSTPELAHALTYLGASAGVMVTASHNPPQDNGYKVYWGNGAQIIPPHDAGISAAVDAVTGLAGVAVPPLAGLRASGLVRAVGPAARTAYLEKIAALRVYDGPTALRIVYTAMHGVGRALFEVALRANGYHDLHVVAAQGDPDPDFPTVAFPNPEEPGALDLALAHAHTVGADLLLAHDPDADRLAVAVPDGQGGYRPLTGNQVGVLFAEELLTHGRYTDPLVATTIVSTGQLRRIAVAHGAACREVLTGFKWIADAALAWPGDFVMGFEEALGYSVGPVVRDKDGISAALIFADLAARAQRDGTSVLGRLEALARKYGLYATRQFSLTLPGASGAAQITAIMDRLRAQPPRSVGAVEVSTVRDVLTGVATHADGSQSALGLPSSNVLAFDLADGARVLARPSGTEPKCKFYFEVRMVLDEGEAYAHAEDRAQAALAVLEADFLRQAGVR